MELPRDVIGVPVELEPEKTIEWRCGSIQARVASW